jgi:hypothetical protein
MHFHLAPLQSGDLRRERDGDRGAPGVGGSEGEGCGGAHRPGAGGV